MLKKMWKKIQEGLLSIPNYSAWKTIFCFLIGIIALVILLPYIPELIIPYKTPKIDILSIIVDIIFILAAIVLTTEIFTFIAVKREYGEVKQLKKESEIELADFKKECDIVTKELRGDYLKFKEEMNLMIERTNALTATAIARTLKGRQQYEDAIKRLNALRGRLPIDRAIIFNLDILYAAKGDYKTGIELYTAFIEEKTERKEFDVNLAHAYFNRACNYARILSSGPNTNTCNESIISDIKNAIRYEPSIKYDGSQSDSDFEGIKNETWFVEIFSSE